MKTKTCIILSLLLIIACASPKKLYEKGKYFKAFDSVLNDIEDGKKERNNLVLLNKSFAKMIDLAREEMNVLEDGYKIKELRDNFKQYEKVDSRYEKGRPYLDDANKEKYNGFNQEKVQLVEDTYLEGKDLLTYFEENNRKLDARNAYYHFELVKENSNDYNDIESLLREAREKAIVIYNIDADLDSDFSYQWDVDRRFDDLEGEEGFYKIVYDYSEGSEDCLVELDFSRLDVDEKESESKKNYTVEVIDGYETKTDTSGNTIEIPIYKDVSGTVTIRTLTKTVSWRIDIELLKSNQNCDLKERRFTESVEDKIEVIEIEGDERAIPDEYKNRTNKKLEDTDDMVDDLLDKLYRDVRNYIY